MTELKGWACWGLMVVFLAGCQSTTHSKTTSPSEGSPLLGLNDRPQTRIWEDWTARPAVVVPPGWVDDVVAFDYWQIDDSDVVEEVWSTLATMLDTVRRTAEERRVGQTATALLEALEAGPPDVHVDVTFVVVPTDPLWEGFVLRMARRVEDRGTSAVAIALLRPADGGPAPRRIKLWAQPGFEEPTPFVMELNGTKGSDWSFSISSDRDGGGDQTALQARRSDTGEQAKLIAHVAEEQIWSRLTGAAYAGAATRADQQRALPEPLESALGLETRDRRISELPSNSAFTPRMETFDPP